MPSVCLVQMPFASLERPSIGLSLLKAGLLRRDISCEVVYANLSYAERVGLRAYQQLDRTVTEDLVGEWLFSAVAFPDYQPDHQSYLEGLQLGAWPNALPELHALRAHSEDFVEQMAKAVLQRQPKIVGCSSVFAQNCASLALLRRVKELAPEIVTVMGGANCEAEMGHTLVRHFKFLDYAVSGEADLLFPEFCQQLLEESRPSRLPLGVISRTSHLAGQLPRATINQLDSLPEPDFDDYFQALSTSPLAADIKPGLVIETSRGCWWGQKHHCTFCGLNGHGMGYRSKDSARVVEEFDRLHARYGLNGFEVVDNIIAMEHLQHVLPEFAERGGPYNIFYETKSNLKRGQVELLAKSGVRWIQPGIESMHSEVLKLMDKGSTAMLNVCLLKWSREFGVRLSWNFLCDFPGERDDWYLEMADWLPLISHLQPPGGLNRVRFDRFSPYFSNPEKYGLTIVAFDSYRAVYPVPEHDLANLAYFFRSADPQRASDRAGIRALREVVNGWKRLFWDRPLPVIVSLSRSQGGLDLLDTRPIAPQRRVRLEGEAAEIYLGCSTPATLAGLTRKLGLASEVVARELEDLCAKKLMLHLDGKFLALAVEGSLPRLPTGAEFPGGMVVQVSKEPLSV